MMDQSTLMNQMNIERKRRESQTYSSKPDRSMRIVDVHQEEDHPRLEISLNIVDLNIKLAKGKRKVLKSTDHTMIRSPTLTILTYGN
jgi:hypothetical protein